MRCAECSAQCQPTVKLTASWELGWKANATTSGSKPSHMSTKIKCHSWQACLLEQKNEIHSVLSFTGHAVSWSTTGCGEGDKAELMEKFINRTGKLPSKWFFKKRVHFFFLWELVQLVECWPCTHRSSGWGSDTTWPGVVVCPQS